MAKSQVPDNIFFDTKLLSFPTLSEVGLEERLCCMGIIESLVKVGDWIERDQAVLKIHLTSYSQLQKPKYFWQKDRTFTATYELSSPISGLVVDMKKAYVAYYSQYANGVEPLVYGDKRVFPVLLVPKDEPSWNNSFFWFYRTVYNFYEKHWHTTKFSHRDKGYIRLNELYSKSDFSAPFTKINEPKTIINFPNECSDSDSLKSTFENLRAYNSDLRDKLVHLINL
ncbi:MAG: hypothetical protein JXR05_09030 [Flavobacteriaceae bacterium]